MTDRNPLAHYFGHVAPGVPASAKTSQTKTVRPRVPGPGIVVSVYSPNMSGRTDETRVWQAKAALYPSEEAILDAICTREGTDRSNLIRELLVQRARAHGLIVEVSP